MKHLFTLLCLFGFYSFNYSQCNPYFNVENGSKWEITNYTSSDKVVSRQVNEITSFNEKSSGWAAEINMKSYDKKDKLEFESDLGMECIDGTIKLDMSRFLPQETMKAFEDMNMKITTDNLEIPSDLSVGATLKDGSITMTADMLMSITTTIADRKVEAKESVTTPAGTFDCYKISYNIKSKSIVNIEMKGVEWLADGVGMVKSESYSKKGKLTGTSLLTSFEQ